MDAMEKRKGRNERRKLTGMIEMQYNFPLLPGQGEQWRERLRWAVEQLHPDNADELRPTFRAERLAQRAIAAKWLGSAVENTWIVCGGHHGTLVSMLAAELAGKTIAVDEISYTGALEQGKMLGAKLVGVAFDHEGMRADALRSVCERERAAGAGVSAIYTMPTVHNPLGCVAGLERRREIVEVAREFDLLIIQDDAYAYMEADAPASYAELAPERTFYTRGLSKSYAPATCTGFLVAPDRFAAGIQNAVKNSTTGTALVNNIAALSLVADGTVDAVITRKLEEGARRNAAARALLGEAAFPGAKCAWLLWVNLPEGLSAEEAEARCAAKGALVSGGNGFAAPGVVSRGLRIGLGGEVEFERMMEGVKIVADVIGAHVQTP
jgi:DNA-binding transcriptional MocR family regulator